MNFVRDDDFIDSTKSSSNQSIGNDQFDCSLDSYSKIFDRNEQNFTTSSEIPVTTNDDLAREDIQQGYSSPKSHNRTFTKEKTTTMINAFTGKPISPNPWRKLSTKNIQQSIEWKSKTDIQLTKERSLSSLSATSHVNETDQNENFQPIEINPTIQHSRLSRRDQPDHSRNDHDDSDDDDDDDQDFEPFEDSESKKSLSEETTPIAKPRRKRNNVKYLSSSSSSSSVSDRDIKSDLIPSNDKDSSWYRLADVYTSEDSDGQNHFLSSETNYTVRLKSEIYTSDQSSSSSSSSRCSSASSSLCLKNKNYQQNEPSKTSYNFLQSLSEVIRFEDKHPDAQQYFIGSIFSNRNKREELSSKLFSMFNTDIFSSKLENKVNIVWSGRLTATAGHCTTRKSTSTAVITLSHKICDSPERCRDTLLHEMCHAAVTLIDGVMEHGHGPLWRQWTRMAERLYPYLPLISVRHTYDILYKFIYRCVQCRHEVYRHSKSLNLNIDCCGQCLGQFELIVNEKKANYQTQRQTPKKTINRYNLYVKENYPLIKQTYPNLSTPQLMKQLSIEYKKYIQEINSVDLPDLNKLNL